MSDIVERLRNWKHAAFRRDGSTLETMGKAADEIERLRAENAALLLLAKRAVPLLRRLHPTQTAIVASMDEQLAAADLLNELDAALAAREGA